MACYGLIATTPAAANSTPVEIQSFWRSPGEHAALAVIEKAFEARGGNWVEFPTRDFEENRRLTIRRIVDGVPPFATQWHGGTDLRSLSQSGVIRDLTPLAEANGWPTVLQDGVAPYLQVDGTYYGLPIGIHAENWTWLNLPLLKRYDGEIPSDWAAMLTLLDKVHAHGGPGIAMGQDAWQRLQLFNQILVGVGGEAAYRMLLESGDPAALDTLAVSRALDVFAALRRYDAHDPAIRSWLDAANALARGDALALFMGDWARPEFARLGLMPDRDFACVLALGSVRRHMSVLDILIFPMSGDPWPSADEQRLADAVLAPDTQREFARLKGALPVRADVAHQVGDPCLDQSQALFSTPGASVPATVMVGNERAATGTAAMISAFWDDPTMVPETFRKRLRQALSARPSSRD